LNLTKHLSQVLITILAQEGPDNRDDIVSRILDYAPRILGIGSEIVDLRLSRQRLDVRNDFVVRILDPVPARALGHA
jgi:hypothetical protein